MRTLVVVMILVFVPLAVFAQNPAESANAPDGIAIEGYDPVAYFTMDRAVPGDPSITVEHDGITYRFSSVEHRDLFVEDPERYVPQYGGWCAWAASQGSLAGIDPTAYTIHDDRLFLNYSGFLNLRFRLFIDENVEQADENWPDLAREAAGRAQ